MKKRSDQLLQCSFAISEVEHELVVFGAGDQMAQILRCVRDVGIGQPEIVRRVASRWRSATPCDTAHNFPVQPVGRLAPGHDGELAAIVERARRIGRAVRRFRRRPGSRASGPG